jgi:hypothetical protein
MNSVHRRHHVRRIAAILGGLAASVLVVLTGATAAFADPDPPIPGPALLLRPPPQVHTIVTGGMPGWQIALIAIGPQRDDPATGEEADRCWQELLGRCAPAAVDVLFMVRSAHTLGTPADRGCQPYERLISAYPDQVRFLLQWGLPNRTRLVPAMRVAHDELPRYMIGQLGRVGDAATVALLHAYLPDPDLGAGAVEAIRTIERRLADNT